MRDLQKKKVSIVFDAPPESADAIAVAVKKFLEINYKCNRVQLFFKNINLHNGGTDGNDA